MKQLFIITCIFLFSCIALQAQVFPSRNFNIYNGLPANYLYNSIVDHHGYIWMTSTQGVIKYNGYNFRIFNSTDGLPKEDVWQLFEDREGRLWIGSIADELGYIYNDKYHSVKFNGNHNSVYPSGFNYYGNGLALFTAYANNTWGPSLYFTDGKVVKKISIDDSVISALAPYDLLRPKDVLIEGRPVWAAFAGLDNDTSGYFLVNNYFFTFTIKNDSASVKRAIKIKSPDFCPAYQTYKKYGFKKQVVFFSPGKQNFFLYLNRVTGDTGKISLTDFGVKEDIQYIHRNTHEQLLYAITKNHLLTFEATNNIKFVSDQVFDHLFQDSQVNGREIVSILKNKLWGTIYTTKNYGAFFSPSDNHTFAKAKFNLPGYIYINSLQDGTAIWWNEATQVLAEVKTQQNIRYTSVKTTSIRDVVQISADTLLLCGYPNYFFSRSTRSSIEIERNDLLAIQRACFLGGNNILTISNFGFLHYSYPKNFRTLSSNRFSGLAINKTADEYWAYNTTTIAIFNKKSNTIRNILPEQLRASGIKSIESIIIDTIYGNIFIKDITNIWVYNPQNNHAYLLPGLENTILRNCKILMNNDQLIIAGKIGVITINIRNANSFDKPRIYTNTNQYTVVYHLHMLNGQLIVNTDKGIQYIALDEPSALLNDVTERYKPIYIYKDKVCDLLINDTVILDQANLSLQFDMINPNGSGQLKYTAWLGNGVANQLTTNELILPNLQPDNYYTLTIVAHDDVWQSKKHTITVYVHPRWYQTHFMKRVFWLALIGGLVLLVAASVLITRRLVINANKKRNARMELELKSIYAQINPHFIFNSLNSALLLVSKQKTDEAYTHISKFSRLLRSYIKSSRNKHVLLAEEIRNLTNYIDLQQVRFKDRFEYNINVNEDVDINSVYIPSLLLQPFVENAIEHGLLSKEGTGHLLINFIKEQGQLICTIDDDGIGRKESKANKIPNPIKDESYGELLIKDLVNIFNKYEHMNIEVSYTDKQYPQTGTTVTIKINTAHITNKQ